MIKKIVKFIESLKEPKEVWTKETAYKAINKGL